MRRYIALIALALFATACAKYTVKNDGARPFLEFETTFYTLYPGGEVDVYVGCSQVPEKDLNILLSFSGDARPEVDFECPESITIKAGSSSTYFVFKDRGLSKGDEVGISLKAPNGWREGVNSKTVVAVSQEEQLIYSFGYKEGVLNEALPISISLAGVDSGKDFIADTDLRIPLVGYGRATDKLEIPDLIIPKGKNSGSTMIRLLDEEWQGNDVLVITVDDPNHRFISDGSADMKVFVRGIQHPDRLLGQWRYRTVYDLEEVELWFEEMGDDPALLPTHNDGFILEFRKEGDKVMLKPIGDCDFANFFRECEVTLTEPMNLTANGYKIGKYSTFESNMFIADNLETYQTNTYYRLSVANRAFSSSVEDLGPATIVFRLTINGDLCMEFRDYDNALPFGENWWDPDRFDPDMFGFPSRFTLIEDDI